MLKRLGVITTIVLAASGEAMADEAAGQRWLERFLFRPPLVESSGVCEGRIGALPECDVTPHATGTELVRLSLPFAPGALPQGMGLVVHCEGRDVEPDVRSLTVHPGQPVSVRRGMVTFPFEFAELRPHHLTFSLQIAPPAAAPPASSTLADGVTYTLGNVSVTLAPNRVTVTTATGPTWTANLIAPARTESWAPVAELIESGRHYLWARLLVPDALWPRIIEVQVDSLGVVSVQAHLQRLAAGDATVPDLGWDIHGLAFAEPSTHAFRDGGGCTLLTVDGISGVTFPIAPFTRRGSVTGGADASGRVLQYRRCTADEKVPYQEAAWRRAEFVLGPPAHLRRNSLLEAPVLVKVDSRAFDALYATGNSDEVALWPVLSDLRAYTRTAIKKSMLLGDDFGNVTGFSGWDARAGAFGMNRLNHGPAIFEEAWRSGDRELRDIGVLWCSNMYDLSLWWGDKEDFGGTRYNNAVAAGETAHHGDSSFMWRTNWASHFCTKGYDAFFLAYEETGDPRMIVALNAQVDYARRHIHANTGECRNIGDVTDFMRLYRGTKVPMYRDEALRLFGELREKLSLGDLFDQGGKPIVADGPFIDDDNRGLMTGYAKPYIIGYALAGLPWLLAEYPDEPKMRDVVRAVADFLAASQDPTGGWRYPHPRSSYVIGSQGMEHAVQLTRAAAALEKRGENVDGLLDAIERTLQGRVMCFARTGGLFSGLTGWERSVGALSEGTTIYDLYQTAADRDPSRDYLEGNVDVGAAPPEGIVHFEEVLHYYLAHRPAERLFHTTPQMAQVLARTVDRRIRLTPQAAGAYLRMERPEDASVGFTLWGPEWVTFPNLGYGSDELGGMVLNWKSDATTGAVWYSIDRPEATFTATFTPHVDYVECAYTVWPKQGIDVPAHLGIGPCQQMKNGVFEGEDEDLMSRLWFVSDGKWVNLASCNRGTPRNVLYVQGNDSPEMSGAMAENGWKTIQLPRPDHALIACTSKDGAWVAGTAAEHSTCICSNAGASHRCLHSQGGVPLRKDGPTTLRVNAYLIRGSLDDLRALYARDVARWKQVLPAPGRGETRVDLYGMRAGLPSQHEVLQLRLQFPLAWHASGLPFDLWRTQARAAFLQTLSSSPPKAPYEVQVLATEDRGSYQARKLSLNISADNRIGAYLLVPEGPGPFPAMVALHDHGAHFSIGKEKVVKPFGVSDARMADAADWVNQYYGGQWIGDRLAERGYVVFAIDVLFWGDRGRQEGIQYEAQQQLAANMLQLGVTWAGTNLWDDIRSAEFVQGLPEVDPSRIGCVGLSMGSNRSWHLAAATDIIRVGLAICWMGNTSTLMSEGNNQTTGQSAFSMIHPGIRNLLDFPDVACIACPKPMLFYNGMEDSLFPLPGVEACYTRLHRVWEAQDADDKLVTKLWPAPHEFNTHMQQEAFDWLDKQLKKP
ncbi:MAG: dienelactone hydrolase family protein [Pirellulaceae bacterium]